MLKGKAENMGREGEVEHSVKRSLEGLDWLSRLLGNWRCGRLVGEEWSASVEDRG